MRSRSTLSRIAMSLILAVGALMSGCTSVPPQSSPSTSPSPSFATGAALSESAQLVSHNGLLRADLVVERRRVNPGGHALSSTSPAEVLFKSAVGHMAGTAAPAQRGQALAGLFLASCPGLALLPVSLGVASRTMSLSDAATWFTAVVPALLAPVAVRASRHGPGCAAKAGACQGRARLCVVRAEDAGSAHPTPGLQRHRRQFRRRQRLPVVPLHFPEP
ncbi:hypothetical protein [Streptomyces broussonetiae]|uniref:hypothetical protein n=1 Tax=Streptomyces broussonetiae TaxID=2686304 RepID=UPI0035DE78E6